MFVVPWTWTWTWNLSPQGHNIPCAKGSRFFYFNDLRPTGKCLKFVKKKCTVVFQKIMIVIGYVVYVVCTQHQFHGIPFLYF